MVAASMRCRARAALAAGIRRPSDDLRPATVRYATSRTAAGRAAKAAANGRPPGSRRRSGARASPPRVDASVVVDEVPGGHSLVTAHPREQRVGFGLLQRHRAQAVPAIQPQQLRERPAAQATVGVVEDRSGCHRVIVGPCRGPGSSCGEWFLAVVLVQLGLVARGYRSDRKEFVFQMFPESSTWRATVVRVTADGRRVPIERPWSGYRWHVLVRMRDARGGPTRAPSVERGSRCA